MYIHLDNTSCYLTKMDGTIFHCIIKQVIFMAFAADGHCRRECVVCASEAQ